LPVFVNKNVLHIPNNTYIFSLNSNVTYYQMRLDNDDEPVGKVG